MAKSHNRAAKYHIDEFDMENADELLWFGVGTRKSRQVQPNAASR